MHVGPQILNASTFLPKGLNAGPKKAEKVDSKKFDSFPLSQGLNTSLYQRLSYKLIRFSSQ